MLEWVLISVLGTALVSAFGGIFALINRQKNGVVTRSFCDERFARICEMVESIKVDLREIKTQLGEIKNEIN